jgi:hypothetical protein
LTAKASRARKKGYYDRHSYDACKHIKGKKRHVIVDTQGLQMLAAVHAADIQDRDGGVLLIATLCLFLLKLYADGDYQGTTFHLRWREVIRAGLLLPGSLTTAGHSTRCRKHRKPSKISQLL